MTAFNLALYGGFALLLIAGLIIINRHEVNKDTNQPVGLMRLRRGQALIVVNVILGLLVVLLVGMGTYQIIR